MPCVNRLDVAVNMPFIAFTYTAVGLARGGGGGHSQYILVGVCRGTSKKGGGS